MVKYCLITDFDAVASMVISAEKEFLEEWGSVGPYTLQDEKDYFRTCMSVVRFIVSDLFSADCMDYFKAFSESRYNFYFGGKKSE